MARFLQEYFLTGFLGMLKKFPLFIVLGCHLVGWSHERCCFNGTCL